MEYFYEIFPEANYITLTKKKITQLNRMTIIEKMNSMEFYGIVTIIILINSTEFFWKIRWNIIDLVVIYSFYTEF